MATGRVPTTANSPLTAKGDLFGYSTTQARVAVGSDGDTLVADSSTSTGLRWQGNYAAGKNKIINGAFDIWQRGTSFSTTENYTADRFYAQCDATFTVSREAFTAGTAPVAGYEGQYYLQFAKSAGGTYLQLSQKIEDVRTFAGQTVTLSAWMRVTSGTQTITPAWTQNFGTGGSASVSGGTTATTATLDTTWTRYSFTISVPSVSGKTIGAGSNLQIFIPRVPSGLTGASTIQIWGVQVEAGSVATAFQTATGTLQGELAACQRYYWRFTGGNGNYAAYGTGVTGSTTQCDVFVQFPTTMRTKPTTLEYSTLTLADGLNTAAVTNLTVLRSNELGATLAATSSGLVQYRPHQLVNNNNSTTAYLGVTAEL